MRFLLGSLLFILTSLSIDLSAEEMLSDRSTGEKFPITISFESQGKEYHLKATGVATRKKLFVNVYSIAHYLQDGASRVDLMQSIMSPETAKQLTIKWVRDVDAAKVQEGFHESFRKVFQGDRYLRQQSDLRRFLEVFAHGAKKGDQVIFRWIPEGNLEILINNKNVGNFSNREFVTGLWTIWFGENSAVNRSDLMSR